PAERHPALVVAGVSAAFAGDRRGRSGVAAADRPGTGFATGHDPAGGRGHDSGGGPAVDACRGPAWPAADRPRAAAGRAAAAHVLFAAAVRGAVVGHAADTRAGDGPWRGLGGHRLGAGLAHAA